MDFPTIMLRASLIFLTAVSFFPQYYRIWDLENCTGISLLYVFLNLIASTEHFSFGLHYILEDGLAGGNGNNVESWINLYLVTIVWGCFLLLFVLYLSHPPSRLGEKSIFLVAYTLFLSVSLGPVVLESYFILSGPSKTEVYMSLSSQFTSIHSTFVTPLITILTLLSFLAQALETLSRTSSGSLSTRGLATQSIVFVVLAISWPVRTATPVGLGNMGAMRGLMVWYEMGGWANVDNAVFAVVQGGLWWLARRRKVGVEEMLMASEVTPLLYG